MSIKYSFFFLILNSFYFLQGQEIIIGLSGGVNFSPPNTVLFVDGEEKSITFLNFGLENGKARAGFLLKAYACMPLNERLSINAELGYEVMRFESHTSSFATGSIHNIGFNITPIFNVYKNWEILLGAEVAYRFDSSTGDIFRGILNGRSATDEINPLHLSGLVYIRYHLPNDMFVGLGMIIPRLPTVTLYYLGLPSDGFMVQEQLNVLRLNVGVPIFRL